MPLVSRKRKEADQKVVQRTGTVRQPDRQRSAPEAFARHVPFPPAAVRPLAGTVGNRAIQRMLVARDSVHAPAPEVAQDESPNGDIMVVSEQFTPMEPSGLPDDSYLGMARVDSGASMEEEMPVVHAPPVGFHDLGRTGTARVGEQQELDDSVPRAFTNGGRTGTVAWGGGGGAGPHGNQGAGSIQAQVVPVFEATPVVAGVSTASVRAGTGTIDVTRSWVGSDAGDQGNGWFVTAGAAARFDTHEELHVNSSMNHYIAHLLLLLARASDTRQAPTQAAAISALRTHVNWAATVTAFQVDDTASNTPMGTVDTADLASGTYPVDAGPGTVGGTAFAHRARLPGEPNPP